MNVHVYIVHEVAPPTTVAMISEVWILVSCITSHTFREVFWDGVHLVLQHLCMECCDVEGLHCVW